MSLRFVYKPMPKVRLLRHQTVTFCVSRPRIEFFARKTESHREDKPFQETRHEKPERAKPSSIVLPNQSLAACYDLMKQLKTKNSNALKQLWNLKGSDLDKTNRYSEQAPDVCDLSGIWDKIESCAYENGREFLRDIIDFFDSVENTIEGFNSTANRYKRDIARAFEDAASEPVDVSDVKAQLEQFTKVEIGEVGKKSQAFDAEELAAKLNRLDEKDRWRASLIIRIHCPALPLYEQGVDITRLPYPAVDSLIALVNESA